MNVDISDWLGQENATSDGENKENVANGVNGVNGGDANELLVMNMTYGIALARFEGLKLFLQQ